MNSVGRYSSLYAQFHQFILDICNLTAQFFLSFYSSSNVFSVWKIYAAYLWICAVYKSLCIMGLVFLNLIFAQHQSHIHSFIRIELWEKSSPTNVNTRLRRPNKKRKERMRLQKTEKPLECNSLEVCRSRNPTKSLHTLDFSKASDIFADMFIL